MSPNALQKLRDWLTIDEAARELSAAIGEAVSAAEVLRLAIDKHLKLSLYLPAKVMAICRRLDADDSIRPSAEKPRGTVGFADAGQSQAANRA